MKQKSHPVIEQVTVSHSNSCSVSPCGFKKVGKLGTVQWHEDPQCLDEVILSTFSHSLIKANWSFWMKNIPLINKRQSFKKHKYLMHRKTGEELRETEIWPMRTTFCQHERKGYSAFVALSLHSHQVPSEKQGALFLPQPLNILAPKAGPSPTLCTHHIKVTLVPNPCSITLRSKLLKVASHKIQG